MPYFGSAPSASALTAAQIDAGVVDSSEIAPGAVDIAHLSASGTAGSGNFLRGDNSWQAAGGDLSFGGDTFGANKVIGANDAYSLSLETSGNTALTIDANGAVIKPLQPCVLATNSAQNNFAINTQVNIGFGTEIFDVGSDFNGVDTFTAPITGKYLISVNIRLDNCDSAANYYHMQIQSSNRDLATDIKDLSVLSADAERWSFAATHIIDMDLNDTVHAEIYQDQGTSQTDVQAHSYFSICLIA